MDGISWIGGKSEDGPKLMGEGERLGLYICVAGGAFLGTMTCGAALAMQKYAHEIRQSCVRNEVLIRKNASDLQGVVLRLSAVNSGLGGGVSILNNVSGAMQRGWKQNVSEYRRVSDETADRLKEIADANGQASERVEHAAAKLEDTQKQQDASVGRLAANAVYSRRHLDGIESSMKLERQNIEAVVGELSTKQHDLTTSVDGVNAATVNLKTAHEDLLAGMNKMEISQREMNSENMKLIKKLLSEKSALPRGGLMLKDRMAKGSSVKSPLVAKKGNADKSDSSSQHNLSEKSYDAEGISLSESEKSSQESDASHDPDRDGQ
jgi:predicted transcriptional regulator